tara:strand:+ start:92 stop:322 length:231 start_codon:yes stop_codon:yes gene_type:complete
MTGKNFIRIQAEIVNGKCPTCHEMTILVGITPEMYRCINCGADLQQHINGKIAYIPSLSNRTLMSDIKNYFNGEEI